MKWFNPKNKKTCRYGQVSSIATRELSTRYLGNNKYRDRFASHAYSTLRGILAKESVKKRNEPCTSVLETIDSLDLLDHHYAIRSIKVTDFGSHSCKKTL